MTSNWRALHAAALVKEDQEKLIELVMAIEDAMFLRAQDSDVSSEERVEMNQAAQQLWIIKTKKLGWPGDL